MSRVFDAILLAGALRPSPLQSALGRPTLCLPLSADGTLLDAWLLALAGARAILAVVSNEADAEAVRCAAAKRPTPPMLTVEAEPSRWRGPAGLLRDAAGRLAGAGDGQDAAIVVIEAHRLPPPSLAPLLEALRGGRITAAVGAGPGDEPAGIYALEPSVCEHIPAVGYFDIKEQLLPVINRAGGRVRLVRLDEEPVVRIRDLTGYLAAVRRSARDGTKSENGSLPSEGSGVSPRAKIAGACVVEPGVRVDEEAFIHDSVVLAGAEVGRGAIVSRSVLGPRARVRLSERVVDRIVADRVL